MERTEAPAAARDGQGRWAPGQSGNPAGKKPGTRNHASLLHEALRDGEDAAVARVIVEKAIGGHFGAARFVADRLAPRPRGRLIDLELPDGAGGDEAIAAIVRRMCDGRVSAEEGFALIPPLTVSGGSAGRESGRPGGDARGIAHPSAALQREGRGGGAQAFPRVWQACR